MPYEVKWHEDKRIIFQHVWGDLDLPGTNDLAAETNALLDQGNAPVHIIADASKMGKFPTNLHAVRNALSYLSHRSLGWSVMIGASPMASLLVSVMTHTTKLRIAQKPNLNLAVEFIRQQDKTLGSSV